MLTFLKILGLWLAGIAIPVLLIVGSVHFGFDTFAAILMFVLYGYILMLLIGGGLKLASPTPLSETVGWAIGLNVIVCAISGSSAMLIIGSMVGIVGCYQLLKLSKHIVTHQTQIA